jgi:D-serine deaminase-like pyridoxal phosphate-dependent protein
MFSKKDWKECLSEEDKKVLEELIATTKRHRCAYLQADDVKVAQLWCALVEMRKELDNTKKLLGKIEEPFRAIVEVGEAEKRKAIEKIVSEIVKPTDKETEEATRKLVESLMKF